MDYLDKLSVVESSLIIVPLVAATTVLCIPYTYYPLAIGYLYANKLGAEGGFVFGCLVASAAVVAGCAAAFFFGLLVLGPGCVVFLPVLIALLTAGCVFCEC